mgnify:FL=1|jgi:hypothetical protein
MSRLTARNFTGFCKRFSYSIAHYDIDLNLNPRRRKIQADVSIALAAARPTRKLCFLLADSCSLDRIKYLGIALPIKISPACPGLNLLSAVLPIRAEAGEKIVVNIIYSWEVPDQGGRSLQLPPDTHWYPFSPLPQNYTCTLNVITDESMRVLGPGEFRGVKPAGTRVCNQWTSDIPFRGIHMAAGDFLRTARPTEPPLEVAYPRKYLNQAKAIANYCEELMGFLAEKLGPAPFPSLNTVLTDNPQPLVSSSFYMTSISAGALEQLKEENPGKDRYVRQYKLLAQSLAHHWLKDNLAVSHPRERWCLEGLAEYISWLAVEAKYGKAIREKFLLEARERILAAPKISLCKGANIAGGQLPQWVVDKAGWMLWICHCLAGEAFLPSIRENLALCRGTAPAPAEFFLSLGKIAGCDFSQVYKAWCQSKNQLRIEVAAARNFQAEDGQWQLVFNLINSGPLKWPYPVEVAMDLTDGASQRHCLLIQKEPHLIGTDSLVQSLTVDPDMTLLNWADANVYKL